MNLTVKPYMFCLRCMTDVTDDLDHDLDNPEGLCPVTRAVNLYLMASIQAESDA